MNFMYFRSHIKSMKNKTISTIDLSGIELLKRALFLLVLLVLLKPVCSIFIPVNEDDQSIVQWEEEEDQSEEEDTSEEELLEEDDADKMGSLLHLELDQGKSKSIRFAEFDSGIDDSWLSISLPPPEFR